MQKIMEYTEMIDKVKALAAQNRAAKTAEDKAEVRRQMDALKESDPKAFAVAVGYMAKATEQQTKDSAVKQRSDARVVARDSTYIFRQVGIMALSQVRWY